MARPSRCRRVCMEPDYDSFIPQGIPCGERVTLTVDEYEVIRLIDLSGLTHEQCAGQMDISRTTATEIYEVARRKIADCIVNGKPLEIAGGNYRLCDGLGGRYCQKKCRKADPAADGQAVKEKGAGKMRIAVTFEDGNVFQHFGHTEQFKLYDIENGEITGETVVDTNGQGHGALSGFLTANKVDVLICGGIGGGAQAALQEAGIRFFGGVTGSADHAVKAYLAESLEYNPDVRCSHHNHEEGHSCGEHHCHSDRQGCAGNK